MFKKITYYLFTQDSTEFIFLIQFLTVPIATFAYGHTPEILPVLIALCIGVCLYPKIAQQPLFWIGMLGVTTYDMYHHALFAANHSWVVWYWLIAVTIATCFIRTGDALQILNNNARWLLIIIMLVAVGWKAAKPEYVNGTFFEFNLVSNTKMAPFVSVVGDLTDKQINSNIHGTARMFLDLEQEQTVLHSSWYMRVIAHMATWWVLLIEFAVGLLLLFYKKSFDYWAHMFHLQFMFFTYMAAPIMGFAWIIWLLGYSLTWGHSVQLRKYYIALALLFFVYMAPWEAWYINYLWHQ